VQHAGGRHCYRQRELQREQPVHLANEPEAEEGERREEWRVGEGG
jgi:hypothetical protein